MGIVNKATDKYQKCIDACNRCAQGLYGMYDNVPQ